MRSNNKRITNKRITESSASRRAGWRIKPLRPVPLLLITAISCCLVWFAHFILATASAESRSFPRKAMLDDSASVRASGRGNPSINLTDGRDVITSFTGPSELARALERNQAEPLSLASADFDEDGVADLVSGYSHSGSGVVAVFRGNVDSIYPNAPEAEKRKAGGDFTDSPFLSPARVFRLPQSPDFIAAGELDGDRHWDIVAAARGSDRLYLMSGDGRGGFIAPRAISLPGAVTALITGEMNQHDGLSDVIVGVVEKDGAELMVFEGPKGALNYEPEVIGLPAAATSLAAGQLDDEDPTDLAVAAGSELVIAHGRNKNFWSGEENQPARISKRHFPFSISSMAVCNFNTGQRSDVALMTEDQRLLVLNGGKTKGKKQEAKQAIEDWGMRELAREGWGSSSKLTRAHVSCLATEDLVVIDSDNRRLQIINRGRATASSMSRPQTLDVASEPVAVLPMRLNKDAQNDLVTLRTGQSLPNVAMTAPDVTIKINSAGDANIPDEFLTLREAIKLASGTLNRVLTPPEDDLVDGDPTEASSDEIRFDLISGGQTIIVGGNPDPNEGPALPDIIGPVTIDGTTQDGTRVVLDGSMAGDSPVGLNIFGSGTVHGVVISHFSRAINFFGPFQLTGSFIGTSADGNVPLGNGDIGAPAAVGTIGGTEPGAGNIISGTIRIGQGVGCVIKGNSVGVSANGIAALTDGTILGTGPGGITIGGPEPGARNVIRNRISLVDGTSCAIDSNYIGTDANGASRLGSGTITVARVETTVANNVIAGEVAFSVRGGSVRGNKIGTDVTGTKSLDNPGDGVSLNGSSLVGIVGNVISGNDGNGISCTGEVTPAPNVLFAQENKIGTDASGTRPLGNAGNGISLGRLRVGDTIKNNVIAFNGGAGVRLPTVADGNPEKDSIISNSIFSNGGLGIDLGDEGVTENDNKDPDGGPNTLQNFPVLTSAASDEINTTVQGNLNSTPNSTFTVEFFSNSPVSAFAAQASALGVCARQGQTPLGSIFVITNSNGNAAISITLPGSSVGGFINCTATSAGGDTSEFSSCMQVEAADLSITSSAPAGVRAGDDLVCNVTVANSGPDPASNITFNSVVPASTTFQRLDAPDGWTKKTPNVGSTGPITCTTSQLLPGASESFTLVVRVDPTAPDMAIVTNNFSVSSLTFDLNQGNNSATSVTFVTANAPPPPPPQNGADVSLTLTGSPATVFADDDITYTVIAINKGPASAKDVVVRIAVPAKTTYQSSNQPDGWGRSAPQTGGTGDVVYTNASLAAGAQGSFSVVVKVDPQTAAGTAIICAATVSSFNDTTANNSSSVTTITMGRSAGPTIQSITVTSQIVATGSGFVKPAQVFIEREGSPASRRGFAKSAKLKGSNRLIQKGKLDDGTSIEKMVAPGRTVLITFRNGNGTETRVRFRN